MMKAAVFVEPGRSEIQERPIPAIGPANALLRVTTTTICGTDIHILKGEYPVTPEHIIDHEPIGIIERLGDAVTGYEIGQRVIAGAITPCGQLVAHRYQLTDIRTAYDLFGHQRDGVLKVAITS